MTKAIAIIVAVVNIVVLLISSIVLLWIQSQISSRSAGIARTSEVLNKVIDQQRMANLELNFAFVHITAYAAKTDNSTALSNAGTAYYGHLQTIAVAGYDEESTDQTEYLAIQEQLIQMGPRFTEDFDAAVKESSELKELINERVTQHIQIIKERRERLTTEKDLFESSDTFVKFAVSGLQFLSLLLLLIRELMSKGSVKAVT